MNYTIMLKRGEKSKLENTGIRLNCTKSEAAFYAAGYRRGLKAVSTNVFTIVVKDEWGNTIYEKD